MSSYLKSLKEKGYHLTFPDYTDTHVVPSHVDCVISPLSTIYRGWSTRQTNNVFFTLRGYRSKAFSNCSKPLILRSFKKCEFFRETEKNLLKILIC